MPGMEDKKNYGLKHSRSTSHRSSVAPSSNEAESGSERRKRATFNAVVSRASNRRRRDGSNYPDNDVRTNFQP